MANMQNNTIHFERQRTAPIMNACKRNVLSTVEQHKPTTYLLPIIEGKPVKSVKSRTSLVTKTKQRSATATPLVSQPSAVQKHRETIAIEPLPRVTCRKSKQPNATQIAKPKKTGKRSASLKALMAATCKVIPKTDVKSKKPSMPSLYESRRAAPITVKQSRGLRIRSKSIVSTDTSTDDEDMDYDDEPSTFFQRPCPCVCGRHNGDDFVGCNGGKRCERKWFHIACMGLRHNDVNSLRGWMCPKCY